MGGGTQGALWTQLVSDILGRTQIIPEQTIAASYGDALMAAITTGAVPPQSDWTRMSRIVEPEPAVSELYNALHADCTRPRLGTCMLWHSSSATEPDSDRNKGDHPIPASILTCRRSQNFQNCFSGLDIGNQAPEKLGIGPADNTSGFFRAHRYSHRTGNGTK